MKKKLNKEEDKNILIETIHDEIFFLNHEIRRPLSNIVSTSELLVSANLSVNDQSSLTSGMKEALLDFEKVLGELNILLRENRAA